MCPSENRFLLLFTFLKKNRKKKVMVFFSSCMSVKFHQELLNYIDLPVLAIHVSTFIVLHYPTNKSATSKHMKSFCFRGSKSKLKEPQLSSSSAMQRLVSCFALMLLPEVWTFLLLIGLFSLIHQMIPR